jgi:hypothetical protein
MRNIALLEWGPASLFYIQPRERIKIRTQWLEGGPIMPPFLSTRDESKASGNDIVVRYALSAFEDLNSAIRNLRRCFGFPYQEYIGYLNTLSRTHRARREHEALVDRLRKWAIFGNVDAVVWIDYAKANQPPGSFKMGPRPSRPFSKEHMELCADFADEDINNGDADSEAASSDIDDEAGEKGAPREVIRETAHHATQQNENSISSRKPSIVLQRGHSPHGAGGVPLKPLVRAAERDEIKTKSQSARENTKTLKAPLSAREHSQERNRAMQENALLRTMIQEEVVPGHGSIYYRTIAPGPGYYGVPGYPTLEETGVGQFGHRPMGNIDQVINATKDAPGPGNYDPKAQPPMQELGKIGKAPRLVPSTEAARKLPFISAQASESEGHGVHSPAVLHKLHPEAPTSRSFKKPPKYSFGKMSRPF